MRFGHDRRQLLYSDRLDAAELESAEAFAAAVDRYRALAANLLVTRFRRDVLSALQRLCGTAVGSGGTGATICFASIHTADAPVLLSGPAEIVNRIVSRVMI